MTLNMNQKIALKYYRAYGALCCSQREDIGGLDQARMSCYRDLLFRKYKDYDPDNSFDVSKDYPEVPE